MSKNQRICAGRLSGDREAPGIFVDFGKETPREIAQNTNATDRWDPAWMLRL
jgi:hypothetical protein